MISHLHVVVNYILQKNIINCLLRYCNNYVIINMFVVVVVIIIRSVFYGMDGELYKAVTRPFKGL